MRIAPDFNKCTFPRQWSTRKIGNLVSHSINTNHHTLPILLCHTNQTKDLLISKIWLGLIVLIGSTVQHVEDEDESLNEADRREDNPSWLEGMYRWQTAASLRPTQRNRSDAPHWLILRWWTLRLYHVSIMPNGWRLHGCYMGNDRSCCRLHSASHLADPPT